MILLLNSTNSQSVSCFRNSHPYNFTANIFQAMNLRNGTCYVTGIGGGHRLYDNGRITTYSYIANMNLAGFPSHDFVTPFRRGSSSTTPSCFSRTPSTP